MNPYEYRVVTTLNKDFTETLQQWGRGGWRAVYFEHEALAWLIVFERQRPPGWCPL